MPYALQVNTEALTQAAAHAGNAARAMSDAQSQIARIASSLPNLGNLNIRLGASLHFASVHGGSAGGAICSVAAALGEVGNVTNRFSNAITEISGLMDRTESEIADNRLQNVSGYDGTYNPDGSGIFDGPWSPAIIALIGKTHAAWLKPMDHGILSALGYQINEDNRGITGWVGRYTGKIQNDNFAAEVNAYIGKGEAAWALGLLTYKFKEEKEYNKKTGKWEEKKTQKLEVAKVKGEVQGSVISADGSIKTGDSILGTELKGEVSVGKGELSGDVELSFGNKGVKAYVGGSAKVTAVEGDVQGTIKIAGFEVTGKVEGYAGSLGVEGGIGFKQDEKTGKTKLVVEGGGAAGIGGGLGIEIGVSDELVESFTTVHNGAKYMWDQAGQAFNRVWNWMD